MEAAEIDIEAVTFLDPDLWGEVYVRIRRYGGTYDPAKASFATWVNRIAVGVKIDRWRVETKSGKWIQPRGLGPEEQHAVPEGADLERLAEVSEVLRSRLPAKYWETLEMVYIRGMYFQSAADEIGIPLGTFKSRISRALMLAREALAGKTI